MMMALALVGGALTGAGLAVATIAVVWWLVDG